MLAGARSGDGRAAVCGLEDDQGVQRVADPWRDQSSRARDSSRRASLTSGRRDDQLETGSVEREAPGS